MWSAEKRAEGLEYMHPKPSSHSGRTVGNPSMIRIPSSKPGLNADSVIHRGLNSLFAGKIALRGLHGHVP